MRLHVLALVAAANLLAGTAAAQEPSITVAELQRRLAASLDSLAAADQFSGIVVIARNGVPVIQLSRGMADREARIPNDPQTGFNLGSINKVFTQIAIWQLAAAGKLDLDSSLARAWPDYPNADVARRVTVRQIVQMRSGIQGNIFATPASGRRHDILRLADYLPLFVNEPLAFEPGTRRQYSNAGYIVLGLLVERLSGETYYDYVRRHIYEPAGMTRTAHFAADSLPPHTAIGYTRADERTGAPVPTATPRRNTDLLPGRGSSAGGGYSTAEDLLKFVAALKARRIDQGMPAGLGVAGGAPGLNATIDGDLPGGYDVIVMANLDPPVAQDVARRIREWLGVHD